mgnify:CR=1 FL=1
MNTRLLLVLLPLAVLSVQAQDIKRDSPWSTFYIPPINPTPHWYEVRGGSWRVSPETLQAMTILVDAEIGRNKNFHPADRAPDYVVQFRGEERNGRRFVRLVGSCRGYDRNAWMLSERFNEVSDGGKCYFDADYDPADKLFRFRYHGYG